MIACEASSELYTIITSEFVPSRLVLLCIECLAGGRCLHIQSDLLQALQELFWIATGSYKDTLTKDDRGAQSKGTSPV